MRCAQLTSSHNGAACIAVSVGHCQKTASWKERNCPPLEIRDDQELLRALCGDELVQIRDNICLSRACPLFSLISPLSLASLIVR